MMALHVLQDRAGEGRNVGEWRIDVQLNKLRILLADDHPLLVFGVRGLLIQRRIGAVIRVASDSNDLIDMLSATPCDLLVTEYAIPGNRYGDGLRLLGYVQRTFPGLRVIVLTTINNMAVCRSIWRSGVAGLLSKADVTETLPLAIQTAAGDRRYLSPMMSRSLNGSDATTQLSPREAEVLRLMSSGLSATEVAERLQRSPKTISRHKRSAMARLGITADSALYQYLSEHGASPTGRPKENQSSQEGEKRKN